MGVRFSLLIVGISAAYAALLFNLYNLQLGHGSYYVARAGSEYASDAQALSSRGAVYLTDRSGAHIPVAVNKDFPTIFAVPNVITDPIGVAAQLGPLLSDIPPADLLKKLKGTGSYALLEKKADSATAAAVDALKIKGIYVDSVPGRYYPLGGLASQVVGFVAPNSTTGISDGTYGVEGYYNTLLAGTSGKANGADLTLTIDPTIQAQAERVLEDLVKNQHAPSGSVIVEDPHTGKILAMANNPSFDPNDYSHASLGVFLNPAVQQRYEPGSVIKVLTMAAGIDAGKITPDTTFNDTGVLNVNGKTIHNWDGKAYGTVTMTEVIGHSLNTGAAFAERQTGDAIFRSYLTKFGLAQTSGIDLPAELKGNLAHLYAKGAQPVAFANASFGQGISMTPITVLSAVAALANGGTLMRPYVNAALPPQAVRQVVSESTAAQLVTMMVKSVDFNKLAVVPGYSIAGKTGTAQVPDLKKGGYTDRVIDTYIGFGPSTDPKFIILIKLDEPAGAPLAGETVVPAFQSLTQFILNYYSIPPDRMQK